MASQILQRETISLQIMFFLKAIFIPKFVYTRGYLSDMDYTQVFVLVVPYEMSLKVWHLLKKSEKNILDKSMIRSVYEYKTFHKKK